MLAAWQAMHSDHGADALIGGESYGGLLAYEAIRSGGIAPRGAVFLSPAFGLHFRGISSVDALDLAGGGSVPTAPTASCRGRDQQPFAMWPDRT